MDFIVEQGSNRILTIIVYEFGTIGKTNSRNWQKAIVINLFWNLVNIWLENATWYLSILGKEPIAAINAAAPMEMEAAL